MGHKNYKARKMLYTVMLLLFIGNLYARSGAKYLIIAPDNFVSALQPLADWKTKKGIKAMIVPLSITGNTASQIKNYILNAYNTWEIRPEYILLAGASSVLPASGSTDDYYANIDGNYLIELSIGRFPGTTVDQISNIVNKTLHYERYPYIDDPSWFLKGMTIVREDYSAYPPTSYPDTYYWENARYCINRWLENGYVLIDSLSKNLGHSATNIINGINNGRAYVIFRGQSTTNWWSPFQVDPASTTNGYKLPVIVSGTCATMSLSSSNYLGNMFINAGSVDNPKGAVGYFASTMTSSGSGLAQQRGTVAVGFYQALFAEGIYKMGDAAKRAKFLLDSIRPPGFSQDRYNEWNLFGDPELNLWTNVPKRLIVTYDSVIPQSQTNLLVTVRGEFLQPIANALVCVRMDTTVYSTGYTNSTGQVQLPINSSVTGIMDVTVTARNCIPFEGTARLVPANVPFINIQSVVYNDSMSNNDGQINPGEYINLRIFLRNDGGISAENTNATLRTTDPNIIIIDSVASYGTIGTGQSLPSQTYYKFFVNPNLPNNYQLNFYLYIYDQQNNYWSRSFSLSVHAGKITYSTHYLIDTLFNGNNNSYLGPNENALLKLRLDNIGSSLNDVIAILHTNNPYLIITDSSASFGSIAGGGNNINNTDPFIISASPSLPKNYQINFKLRIIGHGDTYLYNDSLTFTVTTEQGTTQDPTGPDQYGYWAYDNTDTLSGRAPIYNWLEIGPGGPGTLIEAITNHDAAVTTMRLPFTFKYYGQNYDSISVCSNGFLAMGRTSYRFGNNTTGIPDTSGPAAMIAPLWCDLDPSLAGDIYQYYDAANHRWIVEFYQVAIYNQATNNQTFQVVLYDPIYYPTTTGDGQIEFLYQTVNPPSLNTVGIENGLQTTGIQYMRNNIYHQNAAILTSGRAIKFTTLPPISYQNPWIVLTNCQIADSLNGNNNHIPEPSETIQLVITLRNNGAVSAQNVSVILQNRDGDAIVLDSIKTFGNIPVSGQVNNLNNPFSFQIVANPADTICDFRLIITVQNNNYTNVQYFSIGLCHYAGIETSSDKINLYHLAYNLHQNIPNPFRTKTTIRYSLPLKEFISLKIYNINGELVRNLIQDYQEPGNYQIVWDRKDNKGNIVANGIYFYSLSTTTHKKFTRKMLIY
ncbi:MAG: C25 family cysteine peptidase [candidate division WOR-3 bacterium]